VRKEVLLAIVVGFGLGLVITFGIWSANKALKKTAVGPTTTSSGQQEEELARQLAGTPTSALQQELPLTIDSPEDESVSAQEKITVAGKTAPQATVTILYQEGEKAIEAGNEGNFSAEVTLVGGPNQIEVAAYDQNGNEISKTINVVYSTASI